jgi:hypothetical protein
MKKVMRTKKSTRAKKPSRFTTFTGTIGARTIFLVVIGVMATAMLIAARQESQPASNASFYIQPDKAATTQLPARKPAASKATEPASAGMLSADASDASVPAVDTDAKTRRRAGDDHWMFRAERRDVPAEDAAGADVPKART